LGVGNLLSELVRGALESTTTLYPASVMQLLQQKLHALPALPVPQPQTTRRTQTTHAPKSHTHTVANLGGLIGPVLIGLVVHHTGVYTAAMHGLGLLMAGSAAMVWRCQHWGL